MTCRVIARQRSHVRTIAFILSGKLITEPLNIHFEFRCNYISGARSIVFSVMAASWIRSPVRQLLFNTELLRQKSPVLVEPLEFSDEISQQISVGIDKPIQLIPMGRRMDASSAAVLDPINKFFEAHFLPELQRLRAFIERYNPVPRIANESEFKVGLELFAASFSAALLRHK